MSGAKTWSAVGFSGGVVHDRTIINRIMLRYRPIAPKPVTEGTVSGSTPVEIKAGVGNKKRIKRKYVRVKKTERRCNTSKILNRSEDRKDLDIDRTDVTLQLLPKTTSVEDSKETGSSKNMDVLVEKPQILINFDNSENNNNRFSAVRLPERSDLGAAVPLKEVVESWIMVDQITKAWVDGGGIGCTDMEMVKNLEMDTCPGLISDGLNRVQWVNCAYRKMVAPPEREQAVEMTVWLVVKEEISLPWQAFACTVRVVYTWQKERHSQTMPCDVWKMEFGGFAWRFDANAALSLGR
ncbi:Hypothetical predicted protein [Olea europaea subsp. europaea]|uniref:DUF7950 domain-containing protein n=1 Tax=Olea europaea subsp. europaea TaxID=158383 RepID=A0A8S0TA75_OLEEU|nr:Hypothetical predicted protein [Olea europaea subsp. europaea]